MKNIFNKVTFRSLKRNKIRTIVTIIGVILSTAMICAVTTFAGSLYDYILQSAIWANGSWHGSEVNTDFDTYAEIRNSDTVDSAIYLQQIGYANAEGCINKLKPYIYIAGASEGAEDMLSIHITSGRYPTSSTEILLPEHLSTNGGINYAVGDTLSLEIGDRMLDGFKMSQKNPAYVYNHSGNEVLTQEVLEIRESRTYTIVGFYERISYKIEEYSAPGYTALTIADSQPTDQYCYDIYFKMNSAEDIYDFMENNNYTGRRNDSVLAYQGLSQHDSLKNVITGLVAIVVALIMFASIALIYNAFSISVSERTRQFGLLSSLGATHIQLRKMVLLEAVTVAAIGIPIGVAAGVSGIGITLVCVGNSLSSMFGYAEVPVRLCVSWQAIVIAAGLAFITVLLSAWIPSKRATKISAVEAIRQSSDIKIESRPVKVSKLLYKLFGLPGVLARKYYKRNKRKYTATVISLLMSIVLFISAASLTDYMMQTADSTFGTNGYDLIYYTDAKALNGKTAAELLAVFQSEENTTEATYVNRMHTSGIISHRFLTSDIINMLMPGDAFAPAGYKDKADEYSSCTVYTYFIPDSEYKTLLRQYNLDENEFINSQDPVGIAFDSGNTVDHTTFKSTKAKYLTSDKNEVIYACMAEKYSENYSYIGQHSDANGNIIVELMNQTDYGIMLEVPYDEVFFTNVLKTSKTITQSPSFIEKDYSIGLYLIYPESLYEEVVPEGFRSTVPDYRFYINSSDHKLSYRNLQTVLIGNGLASERLHNHAESVEQNRNTSTVVSIFAYGFTILLSLIAAANVFNTISTNIALRRREFAMLKSVGMTQKGLHNMMNFECLIYGTKALILGIPISCIISYIIYNIVAQGFQADFHLPWAAIGIAVLSVFAIVFITMLYSIHKIKKDNLIDVLKNENH